MTTHLLDNALITEIATDRGAWTREQLGILGVPWPPSQGWRKRLVAEKRTLSDVEVEELREARDEAQTATQAKASFLATMSHEIRTHMNGASGMGEMLVKTKLQDDQRQLLRTVLDSSYPILRHIKDLRVFSK